MGTALHPPYDPGPGAVLRVDDAVKSFGARRVLDRVSLSLHRGEILALLGPNGAGKTTLVRAICGRLPLDAGGVSVAGGCPRLDPDVRRLLGFVPQEIALYPDLTVRENLSIFGRLAGLARRSVPAAVERALVWTGMEERAGDRTSTLSGGMKRRVNIAAGTLHDPHVLLLDEPTVGIDPAARETIHAMLSRLRAEGMGILVTTHDMEQAEVLADRVGVLVDGRIRAEGTLEELVRDQFAGAKELNVVLSEEPDPSGIAVLREANLRPSDVGGRWTGNLSGGLDDLSELDARIKAAGLHVTEVQVREPGLRSVFFRVTGREFEQ